MLRKTRYTHQFCAERFIGLSLCALVSVASVLAGGAVAGPQETAQTSVQPFGLKPRRPVNTYSIVARDPETGELGAAVQSHWFSVGSMVIWAAPGVGAVATQSFVDPAYGPRGLDQMRAGKTATDALTDLIAKDQHQNVRQVAMVDARGNVGKHTGEQSIDEHCDLAGDGFSVQANLMWKPTVCTAMAAAFEAAEGDLGERMLLALEAAEREGGDVRGKQSAAILVVNDDASLPAWSGRVFDLRVEDHPEPLEELRRLMVMARAYQLMNLGDEHMAEGRIADAIDAYAAAEAIQPDSHEMVFWHAVTLASADRLEESLPMFARAFAAWPKWRDVVGRLPASGLLPDDEATISAILSANGN